MDFITLAGVAIFKGSKILLLQQTPDGDQPGLWGPPAGHANENESLFEAAVRETKEETNLDITLTGFVQAGAFTYKDQFYVAAFYAAIAKNLRKLKSKKKKSHNTLGSALKS